jgi:lysophospholipase L1-like esterase
MKNPIFQIAILLVVSAIAIVVYSVFVKSAPENIQVDFLSDIKTEVLIQDSIEEVKDSVYKDSIIQIGKGQIEQNGALDKFFSGLDNLSQSNKSIHIGHFGDSQIEGDLLTTDIRDAMQNKFGGNGVGWMPLTSIVAGYRVTIGHQYNENWSVFDFQNGSNKYRPGPTGQVFIGNVGASTTFTSTKHAFKNAWLIADPNSSGTMSYTVSGKRSIIQWPNNEKYFLPLPNSEGKQINIQCDDGSPAIYGLNFENGKGCYVDNFAYRGSSGSGLSQLPTALFKSLEEIMDYKLIILEFGLNVHSVGSSNYKNYESSLDKTIKHIKQCFPNASILVIGISDKGRKIKGEWQSDVTVRDLELVQRNVAASNGCAFFSLYEAMGGEGSIIAWVEDSIPKLANNDYTHLSRDGTKLTGKMIFDYLMRSYDVYKNKNAKN